MKKVRIVLILCLCLICVSACSGGKSSSFEVTNGISLGMSLKDTVDVATKANSPIDQHYLFESTIAEQPYSIVFLSFVDDIDSYSSKIFDGVNSLDNMPYILADSQMTYNIDVRRIDADYGKTELLKATEENSSKKLVQACVNFTSDQKYSSATDTFETVEKYLIEKYGETRYTSRRGESLPVVWGYEYIPNIISQVIYWNTDGEVQFSVPYYSQRTLDLDDNTHIVIDHNIRINERKKTFTHRLVFTLIPQALGGSQ